MNESEKDEMFEKAYEKNLKRIKKIAEEKGYKLNSDEERVKKVVGKMTKNYIEHEKYYCSCKQSHPLNAEKDVLCPCPTVEKEVEEDGHCHCQLFYR